MKIQGGAIGVFAKMWRDGGWREVGTCETLPSVNRYGWCHIVMLPRTMEDVDYLDHRSHHLMDFKFSSGLSPDVVIEGNLLHVNLHSDFGPSGSIDVLLERSKPIKSSVEPSEPQATNKLYVYDTLQEKWNVVASISDIYEVKPDLLNECCLDLAAHSIISPIPSGSCKIELGVDSIGLQRTSRRVGMELRYAIVFGSAGGEEKYSFSGKIESAKISPGHYGGGKVTMEVSPDFAGSKVCDVYHILFPFDPIQDWADRELARIEEKYKWIGVM